MGANQRESENSSESSSNIWGPQQGFLKDLWEQSQGAAGETGQGMQDFLGGFMPGLQDAMQNVGGMTDPQAQIDAQSASLKAGLGDMFRTELMPALQSNAISAGSFGGGRQGVAEANAVGEISQAFTQGLGEITARANQTALGAGGLLGQMGQGGLGMIGQAGMGPLGQLAQIIGNPAILQQQKSSGSQTGWGFSFPGFGG